MNSLESGNELARRMNATIIFAQQHLDQICYIHAVRTENIALEMAGLLKDLVRTRTACEF